MNASDVVIMTMYMLGEYGYQNNRSDVIHKFFFAKKNDPAFIKMFPDIVSLSFNTHGTFPCSSSIDSILGDLQLSGILSKKNPYYDEFEIAEEMVHVPEELLRENEIPLQVREKMVEALSQAANELRTKLA